MEQRMEHEGSRVSAGSLAVSALLGLLLLGDLLFWRAPLGLSLVIFAWAIFAAVAVLQRRLPWQAALALGICSLPALEYVQLLSVCILAAGLLTSVAWLYIAEHTSPLVLATRIAAVIPHAAIRALIRSVKSQSWSAVSHSGRAAAKAWAFPVGGALVLLALMVQANPILFETFEGMLQIEPDWLYTITRILFWAGLAVIVWPFLEAPNDGPIKVSVRVFKMHLPADAIMRALILFNLVLALQLGLDALVLLGGGVLPEGMTYAQYARRGAFPLFGATLLGCAFAVVAGRASTTTPWLKLLLFLWLFQNLVIAAGAGLRLSAYVEAYGLTYLRMYAGIGMAVVAGILMLIALQIGFKRPERWLIARAGLMSLAVLYAASFVNFADIIARQNIARGGEIDWRYLVNDLPATARATIAAERCSEPICARRMGQSVAIEDWREWGFRRWRVERRITQVGVTEPQT